MLLLLVGATAGTLVGLFLPYLLTSPPSGPWWWCRESLPPTLESDPTAGWVHLSDAARTSFMFLGTLMGLLSPWFAIAVGLMLQAVALATPRRHVRTCRHGEGEVVEVSMTWQGPGWNRTLSWTLTEPAYRMLGAARRAAAPGELSCLYFVAELVQDPDRARYGATGLLLGIQARQAAAREQSNDWGRLQARWTYRTMLARAEAHQPLTVGGLLKAIAATCPRSRRLLQIHHVEV